jgi:MFS family permease
MGTIVYTKTKASNLTSAFIICFIATLFSGIVSMLSSVYLPDIVKDLVGNISKERLDTISATINSVFIFGWMFGGFAWGFICDKIGRKNSVTLSVALFGLFALLTSFAASWFEVCICRFIAGFGIGGVMVATTILVTELWQDKKKAIVMGIVSVAMPIGFFIAGAMNNFLSDWRDAFKVGIIPFAMAIISFFILPESEKWKTDDSKKDNTINKIFDESTRKNLFTGSVIFGAMLIGLWAIFSWAPTWVQSISTSVNATQQRGLTMMVLATGGLAGSFVSGWIVNLIGLRKTMMMCFAVCFIMAFVVFRLSVAITSFTFAELGILTFFFGISQGALAVYIPQLFPVKICASATGFCFNVSRLFTGTVVFFIGALVGLLGGYGNAIFIFSFVFLIGLVATFFSKDNRENKINNIGVSLLNTEQIVNECDASKA